MRVSNHRGRPRQRGFVLIGTGMDLSVLNPLDPSNRPGLVVAGSITEDEGVLRFEVTDGAETIPVVLTSTPPALFADDVPVLLEGSWSGDSFSSDNALIRHDENYEVPEEGGGYPTG